MINSRFEELQRKCKSINRKKLIYRLITLFLILLIFFSGWYIYKSTNKIKNKKIVTKKQIIIKSKKTETLTLSPQIDIQKLKIVKKTKTKIVKKELHKVIIKEKKEKIVKKKIPSKIKFKINLTSSNEETILLKNFQISKKYSTALKLSKYYLASNDYKKAIFWAKNASKLDSTKAEPWIVYAKSKYAMGEKKNAIASLQTFLNYFYSKEANTLLQKYLAKK